MLKKEIVNNFKELFSNNELNFTVKFENDRICLTRIKRDYKCLIELGFFKYQHYQLKIEAQRIIKFDLEEEFGQLIIQELNFLEMRDITFSRGGANFTTHKAIDFVLLENEEVLETFFNNFLIYLQEVEEKFFIPGERVEYLASLIAEHDFKNNSKVLVGGQYPVQFYKKMFILHKGGQLKRYQEYKEGTLNLINTMEEWAVPGTPSKELCLKNFEIVVDYLEKGKMPAVSPLS